MSYYGITHVLLNGMTAILSIAKPGEYAIYGPDGKFVAYAKTITAAKEFAKNFGKETNSPL